MGSRIYAQKALNGVKIYFLLHLAIFSACVLPPGQASSPPEISPPPSVLTEEPNVVQLDPLKWEIYYSGNMPLHPSRDPEGAWSFEFPGSGAGGHVNYVQTPFRATMPMHNITITFKVESDEPVYNVIDTTDILPATFHLFFEQQGDNLIVADGRWWAQPGYNLGSEDNQTLSISVPLTSDHWSDVYGKTDPQRFAAAWNNVGWVGITFGGQYFWGHGVALASGNAKFILINYQVN